MSGACNVDSSQSLRAAVESPAGLCQYFVAIRTACYAPLCGRTRMGQRAGDAVRQQVRGGRMPEFPAGLISDAKLKSAFTQRAKSVDENRVTASSKEALATLVKSHEQDGCDVG